MDRAQNEREFAANIIRVDFNRERFIRCHQKRSGYPGYSSKELVTVVSHADLSLDINNAAANEEQDTDAYLQDLRRLREFAVVFLVCMLSVIGLVTLTANGDRNQNSDMLVQDAESHPEMTIGSGSGNHDMRGRRGIRSQGGLDQRVEHILDSNFRATLSQVAKWREQSRLLVMYREQLSTDAEFRPAEFLSPIQDSQSSADTQREWN